MFLKVLVFLFSISAILAYNLRDTPEELWELFRVVAKEVNALQKETTVQIRANEIPLAMYIDEAKVNIMGNITDAAKPYWTNISALEETAQEQGKNISECLTRANNQLYALNETMADQAYQMFNYYEKSGNDILDASDIQAYSVINEQVGLDLVVRLCRNETCATELSKAVTQYLERSKLTLIDAETKSSNYVLIYLPALLTAYSFDAASYAANYTVYLNDVINCINKL